jgi:hypothetical protein
MGLFKAVRTSEVVALEDLKLRRQPHGTGEAKCSGCQYEWTAVVPVGVVDLECPKCLTMKGRLVFPYELADGTLERRCVCQNNLFKLTPEGYFCPNCGDYMSYESLWLD